MEDTDLFTPFKASVDASLITSASSFFDNKTTSVIRELLQNSRRSGATEVYLEEEDAHFVYFDNGPGCRPKDLLGLGSSRWTESVRASEQPAGCGFFALSRRNPFIRCPARGWEMELNERHFNGELPIEPRPLTGATPAGGLSIRFAGSGVWELRSLAQFMPLDFFINGQLQPSRKEFLAPPSGSVGGRVFDFDEHIRIRVDLVKATSPWLACYHGHTVAFADRDYLVFPTSEGTLRLQAAIEVANERALPLELPQRNTMIRSATTQVIKTAIRHAGLALAAQLLRETSIASPEHWISAKKEGYRGDVLYPKFVGRRLLRPGEYDLTEHVIELTDEGKLCELGAYLTLEDLETQTLVPCPNDYVLSALTQTQRSEDPEEFAKGLKLFAILPDLKAISIWARNEELQSSEWFKRFVECTRNKALWCDDAQVVATRKNEQGETVRFVKELELAEDCEHLYDTLQLEILPEDAENADPMVFELPALFHLVGDKDSRRIDFLMTAEWFAKADDDAIRSIAWAAESLREAKQEDDEDEEPQVIMAYRLEEAFATFRGFEQLASRRLLQAVSACYGKMAYSLENPPAQITLVIPTRPGGRSLCLEDATCTFAAERGGAQ